MTTSLTNREYYRYTELFEVLARLGLVEWGELDITFNVTVPLEKIDVLGVDTIREEYGD
jgi:hypothetical protein